MTPPDPAPFDWRARAVALGGFHRPVRVFLVEAEPGTRRLFARLLEAAGYGVVEAEDAGQALEILGDPTVLVHVAVVDAELNGFPGELLVAHLKQTRPATRVVVCSGEIGAHAFDTILDAGADVFLAKPLVRLAALVAAVELLLARPHVLSARSA